MKISVIGPVYPYRGGIAHFTTSLCRELAEAGHQVQAVSFKRQYPDWLYPGQSDKDPSLLHEQVPAQFTLDPFFFWTWWQAARQAADFAPDLVIIQWWTTFWAPAFYVLSAVLNRRRIPCVFCIHNVIPHENRLPDVWLARRVLSNSKGCITLSPNESRRLMELLPSVRIFPARLPVPRVLHPLGDRRTARKELGLAEDRPVLLFFGIVRPYKGLPVLIDALGILRKEDFSPALLVAGEFWEDVAGYQKQIAQQGLADQVILLNRYIRNEELGSLFSAADAFVAPYTQGTQSAAIKTAMSYRLPILASDHIAGDLDSMNYPIFIHRAGDAADLAIGIRKFFQQGFQTGFATAERDDWLHLVELIRQIGTQL